MLALEKESWIFFLFSHSHTMNNYSECYSTNVQITTHITTLHCFVLFLLYIHYKAVLLGIFFFFLSFCKIVKSLLAETSVPIFSCVLFFARLFRLQLLLLLFGAECFFSYSSFGRANLFLVCGTFFPFSHLIISIILFYVLGFFYVCAYILTCIFG